MAKKKVNVEDQNLEKVQNGLNATGLWIEKNLVKLVIAIVVVALLGGGAVAYKQYVVDPKNSEINEETANLAVLFMQGDYELALNGDSTDVVGFKQLADENAMYKGGKLAALYAGACYYQLEKYAEAVEYLSKFSANDKHVSAAASQLLGDAYVHLEDYANATKAFNKAAKTDHKVIAPMSLKKAGLVYLEMGDKAAAKKAFETIKADYPHSLEARDIEKYIALAE